MKYHAQHMKLHLTSYRYSSDCTFTWKYARNWAFSNCPK